MPHTAAVRDTVLAALRDPTDRRSRAQLAREHGVSTRTVSRWADDAGIPAAQRWATADTRAATAAATDRRRHARSQLADDLLNVEIPALRARMAAADTWTKTVVVPCGMGESEVRRVTEDDAVIANGLQKLHTAVGIAVDKTIAIDRHDVQADGDDQAATTLGRLFDGLAAAYRVLDQPDQGETP